MLRTRTVSSRPPPTQQSAFDDGNAVWLAMLSGGDGSGGIVRVEQSANEPCDFDSILNAQHADVDVVSTTPSEMPTSHSVPYDYYPDFQYHYFFDENENKIKVYKRLPRLGEIPLDHGSGPWGQVSFGRIVESNTDLSYQDANDEDVIAIKRLNLRAVELELQRGDGGENPYNEIHRLRTIGDDIHVLRCKGILKCQHQNGDPLLFIVSRRLPTLDPGFVAVDLESKNVQVKQHSEKHSWLSEREAKVILRQLLDCLHYIHEEHQVCHADISLGNVLIDVCRGSIILIDMAASFDFRRNEKVKQNGYCGKPSYLTPEVYFSKPYDPKARDLRACIVVIFALLTGDVLYDQPTANDPCYDFFVTKRHLSKDHRDIISGINDDYDDSSRIGKIASSISRMSDDLLDVFENTLVENSEKRWTADDVLRSAWMSEN